ncbi:MAG: TauD/TfdA family dioxygenase [Sphingomonadaceae bacterium]|nr:TauD/TfdA family dioxygenase [Sphingomonadaceae bacterium]
MDFKIDPLHGTDAFGAIVTGLTPAAINDADTRKQLYDLWIDKGVIVFKGLADLDTQISLSEIYGKPEIHPLLVGIDRPREHFVIAEIEYVEEDGDLYEIDGELRGGYLPWHFDLAYMDRINHGGILRGAVLPNRGGETGFIDGIAAYDALPDDLKQRIEGRRIIYRYLADATQAKFGEIPDKCISLSSKISLALEHPAVKNPVTHPMVYSQKGTGRKVLNISPWHAVSIEGMEGEEGDELLRQVIDLMIRPELAYYHEWQEDDMVLWDNWRMLHCACGVPPGEQRKMRRTTIAGDYALGRQLAFAED